MKYQLTIFFKTNISKSIHFSFRFNCSKPIFLQITLEKEKKENKTQATVFTQSG